MVGGTTRSLLLVLPWLLDLHTARAFQPRLPAKRRRCAIASTSAASSGRITASSTASQQNNNNTGDTTTDFNPADFGLRGLYPPSVTYRNGTLAVDQVHTLYYEVYGRGHHHGDNAADDSLYRTALFLHGGPGAGCVPNHARFFDPTRYRIVLLDQRGSGRSTPRGATQFNTLLDVVEDCERLRRHLDVDHWDVVLGGSWGTTVAVAYTQLYPAALRAVVLRGVCLLRPNEVQWLFASNGGMAKRYPEQWQAFAEAVDKAAPSSTTATLASTSSDTTTVEAHPYDVLYAYYDRLLGSDPQQRLAATQAWMRWEMNAFTGGAVSMKNQTTNSSNNQQEQQKQDLERRAAAPVAVYTPPSQQWEWQDGQGARYTSLTDPPPCADTVQNLRQGLDKQAPILEKYQSAPRPLMPVTHDGESATVPSPINATSKGQLSPEAMALYIPAQAMLTCFYSANRGYAMNHVNLLERAANNNYMNSHKHVPYLIAVHGGNDGVCPVDTALDLLTYWPSGRMELRIPLQSGHSMYDVMVTNELVRATDRLAQMLE